MPMLPGFTGKRHGLYMKMAAADAPPATGERVDNPSACEAVTVCISPLISKGVISLPRRHSVF